MALLQWLHCPTISYCCSDERQDTRLLVASTEYTKPHDSSHIIIVIFILQYLAALVMCHHIISISITTIMMQGQQKTMCSPVSVWLWPWCCAVSDHGHLLRVLLMWWVMRVSWVLANGCKLERRMTAQLFHEQDRLLSNRRDTVWLMIWLVLRLFGVQPTHHSFTNTYTHPQTHICCTWSSSLLCSW